MQILISISCILNKPLPPFTWRVTGRRSGLKGSFFFLSRQRWPLMARVWLARIACPLGVLFCVHSSDRKGSHHCDCTDWEKEVRLTGNLVLQEAMHGCIFFFSCFQGLQCLVKKMAFERKQVSFGDMGGGAAGWFTAVAFSEHHSQIQPALQCAGETRGILGWNLLLNFSWSAPSRITVGFWKDG